MTLEAFEKLCIRLLDMLGARLVKKEDENPHYATHIGLLRKMGEQEQKLVLGELGE